MFAVFEPGLEDGGKGLLDHECYGYRPVLMETLVDQSQFKGTCYKAANWVHVGQTTGRGRMDRQNKRKGMAVKDIYLYPLSKCFRKELMKS